MKEKSLIIFLIAIILSASCNRTEKSSSMPISKGSNNLTVINLNLIPDDTLTLNLSDLISDYQMIPLETKKECLITFASWIQFTKNDILIGTQQGIGPAELYRFDRSGKFMNSIGTGGKGPNEHMGYVIDNLELMDEHSTVLVNWGGQQKNAAQVFTLNGTLVKNIVQPYRLRYIYGASDSTWFCTGRFGGEARTAKDSLAIVFFNSDGQIIRQVRRSVYPPANTTAYVPSPHTSVINNQGTWKVYMDGNDTIFRISGEKMIPDGYFVNTPDAIDFNNAVKKQDLTGKYELSLLSETEDNWYMVKSIYTKIESKDNSPGLGRVETKDELFVCDKKTGMVSYIKVQDDLFSLIPGGLFSDRQFWINSRYFAFGFPVIDLLGLIKQNEESVKQSIHGKELLETMKNLKPDSNPVVFQFALRDKVVIQ